MNNRPHSVVVGGGISGLCVATLLVERYGRENVLVLDAGEIPGGVARTEAESDYLCEWGPNGFLDREPKTLEWVSQLGLDDHVVKANEAAAHRFIVKNDRLVELVGPPKFLVAPILSMPGRLRLLCEPFIKANRDHVGESIWQFAARRIGKEAADTLVSPMVSGVFGGDAKELSLEHCFPRMAAMEKEHGSLFNAMKAKRREGGGSPMGPGGTLTSFRDGIQTLPQRAAEQLGNSYQSNKAVGNIERATNGYRIRLDDDSEVTAEKVVLATPAYVGANIVNELDAELSAALARIPYASIAVVCTGYARDAVGHDLDGFGFLIPRTEGKRVLGTIWTSSVFPNRAPEGHVLLRTMIGGATDPDAVRRTDEELLRVVEKEVHPLLSINKLPEYVRFFRHERGIPQYVLGHGEILDAIDAAEARLPGFAVAGNAYRGVGINDCVVSAHRAVARLD